MVLLRQKFLILMKSNFSLFSCRLCFDVVSKKALPNPRSWRFMPTFSSDFTVFVFFLSFFFFFFTTYPYFIYLIASLMVHKMFSVVHLSFVHTEVSCFLCSIAAAAAIDLFSFRIMMGTFI